jgi:hypothetical protein
MKVPVRTTDQPKSMPASAWITTPAPTICASR